MSAPKSKVKVLLRTRPTSNFAQDVISFGSDRKSVHIHIPKDSEGGHINNQQENWDFKLDRILHNAGQETMFEEAALPIIKTLLDGYNGTLMAYGTSRPANPLTRPANPPPPPTRQAKPERERHSQCTPPPPPTR